MEMCGLKQEVEGMMQIFCPYEHRARIRGLRSRNLNVDRAYRQS